MGSAGMGMVGAAGMGMGGMSMAAAGMGMPPAGMGMGAAGMGMRLGGIPAMPVHPTMTPAETYSVLMQQNRQAAAYSANAAVAQASSNPASSSGRRPGLFQPS